MTASSTVGIIKLVIIKLLNDIFRIDNSVNIKLYPTEVTSGEENIVQTIAVQPPPVIVEEVRNPAMIQPMMENSGKYPRRFGKLQILGT